jgi:hypothetical protein
VSNEKTEMNPAAPARGLGLGLSWDEAAVAKYLV